MLCSVAESVPEQHRITRDLVIAKLREIESDLREVDDVGAMEVIQRAISELEADQGVRDRKDNRLQVTAGRVRQAAQIVGSSIQAATDTATTVVRDGASRATAGLAAATAAVSDKGRSGASGAAAGFGVAHETLTAFQKNLDWNSIVPTEYVSRFVTAGTRGIDRSLEDAHLVWETIPEHLRALGPEEVAKRLWGAESVADRFDWSHIVPHSQGGGTEATNGIFELASINRSRGAKLMEPQEYDAAVQVLSDTAFKAALVETASQVLSGAAVGAAVSCVLACLEHGLEYQRGEITREEMYQYIGRAVAKSAGIGAAVAGVMAVVSLAFPALIPLTAPLVGPVAILAFCAVGGRVVGLGKGWYEVYQDAFGQKVPGLRLAMLPIRGAIDPE